MPVLTVHEALFPYWKPIRKMHPFLSALLRLFYVIQDQDKEGLGLYYILYIGSFLDGIRQWEGGYYA